MSKPNLAQGEGGARSTRKGGSHLTPHGEGGVKGKGPSGDHLTTQFTSTDKGGSHLEPHELTDHSPVRGAGGVKGHDRVGPANHSGSPTSQNPNVKTKR